LEEKELCLFESSRFKVVTFSLEGKKNFVIPDKAGIHIRLARYLCLFNINSVTYPADPVICVLFLGSSQVLIANLICDNA